MGGLIQNPFSTRVGSLPLPSTHWLPSEWPDDHVNLLSYNILNVLRFSFRFPIHVIHFCCPFVYTRAYPVQKSPTNMLSKRSDQREVTKNELAPYNIHLLNENHLMISRCVLIILFIWIYLLSGDLILSFLICVVYIKHGQTGFQITN